MALDVLFDHQVFVTQRHGGVSRYFLELARAMQLLPDVHARVFAPGWICGHLQAGDPLHPWSFPWPRFQRGLRYRPSLFSPVLRAALLLGRPRVVHETGYVPTHVRARGTINVTTLHDMTVEVFPEWFEQSQHRIDQKLAALRRADAIICISQRTRQDLLDRHPDLEPRCAVVPHGVSHQRAEGPRPGALPARYLLYVGTRQNYKNFSGLLQALGRARGLPADLQLLCFGGGPLSADELQGCQDAGWAPPRVKHLQGDDDLLAQAYRHAELFVFPSLYEGFGMPLTEAMVQGCPVACSRATSFPEVCGDGAAYFDPQDPQDMAACLEGLVLQPARRAALAQAGAERVRLFSWSRCAEDTLAVYRRALEGRVQA